MESLGAEIGIAVRIFKFFTILVSVRDYRTKVLLQYVTVAELMIFFHIINLSCPVI